MIKTAQLYLCFQTANFIIREVLKTVLTLCTVIHKKTILVFLLLCCYFVGWSHSLIPHHHVNSSKETKSLHKHHLHPTHSNDEDHAHVEHNDHFDEDFLDFLYCFLSESEHADFSSNYELLEFSSQKTSFQSEVKLIAVDHQFRKALLFQNKELFHSPPISLRAVLREREHLHSVSFRGPPSS